MADPLSPAGLSSLIDGIYACVLDRDRWGMVLAEITDRIGGCAASLNQHDLTTRTPQLVVECGTDPAASASYVASYGAINPLIDDALLYTPEGEVTAIYDVVDLPEFQRSRFYREWVAPQGWGDWIGAMLIRTTASLAMLNIARPAAAGPYPPEASATLRALVPHLQRATMIGRVFDAAAATRAGLAAMLDHVRAPALLVAADGRVGFANAAAAALLAERSVAADVGGRLILADPTARRQLERALTGDATTPATIAVGPAAARRVLSIVPASASTGDHALVVVTPREPELPLPGPLLAAAFGLTPAEIRVLVALFKRRSLTEIADDNGIAVRTVKAHLQGLFAKTGTRRQADLLVEVLRLIPPVAMF
jgi:DNA-binding CsgD family transcriptional regulator